jgi:hypothetical protein
MGAEANVGVGDVEGLGEVLGEV